MLDKNCLVSIYFFKKDFGKIEKNNSLYQPALFEHNQNSVYGYFSFEKV
jgi:hypothetical protein